MKIVGSVSLSLLCEERNSRAQKKRKTPKRRVASLSKTESPIAIAIGDFSLPAPSRVSRPGFADKQKKPNAAVGYFLDFLDSDRPLDARGRFWRFGSREKARRSSRGSRRERIKSTRVPREASSAGGSARRVPDVDADGIVRVLVGVVVSVLFALLDVLHVNRPPVHGVEQHIERHRLGVLQMLLLVSRRRGDGFVVRLERGDVDGRRALADRESCTLRRRRGDAPEPQGVLAPGERGDAHDRRVRPASKTSSGSVRGINRRGAKPSQGRGLNGALDATLERND
jgi:hypothetical protein